MTSFLIPRKLRSKVPPMNEGGLRIKAHAKTNLDLRVHGKRDDGYHDLSTRMVPLSLHDQLLLSPRQEGSGLAFEVEDEDWEGLSGPNLVVQAYDAFTREFGKSVDVSIVLRKRIPSGAGLGGGSSDAAATLRGLNELTGAGYDRSVMMRMAAELGSDVPFFIDGVPARCEGRGEQITPMPEADWILPVVLIKPAFAVATAEVYRCWQDSREIPWVLYAPQLCPWGEMHNDLERPAFEKFPLLADMKMWLLDQPEVHAAILSGSGSTLLVVLSRQHGGEHLVARAREEYGETLWTYVGRTLAG